MAMSNELLPTGYFEDLLDLLKKPNYDSTLSILDETVETLLPSEIASATAISLLTKQINQCHDVYHLVKLLLLLHKMINRMKMGRLFLLEALCTINLNKFHKACCFDIHFTSTILRQYVLYLMKLCSSYEVYTFSQKPQKLASNLYLFGCLNIIKYCWPLLKQLRRYEPLLKQTYPYILDCSQLIVKDVASFVSTIVRMANECQVFQIVDKQLKQMYEQLKTFNDWEQLREQIEQEAPEHLACQYRQNISDFMSSEKKQGCLTSN